MAQQKTWLITGISSGFGRLMAEKLLQRGDRVLGTARKLDALKDLQARYGERLSVLSLDLTDAAKVRDVVDAAFAEAGRVDVVVSNAGYGLFGAGEEVTDEQIRQLIDTNLIGSMALIRSALPHLRAQGGGRVLQVSSTGGQFAYPAFSVYHATKWGIEGFVESVSKETAPFGIEFTIVEPGANKTEFISGMVRAEPMPVYDQTPVGELRRMVAAGGFPSPGDPAKAAQAMIDSVEQSPAPLRLPLGSDTYHWVHEALTARLAALEGAKDVAFGADISPAKE